MKRPYFIWDYDLTEEDVRNLLKEGSEQTKRWLAARILESAKFEDVWKYLTIRDIVGLFPQLPLRPQVRQAWEKALKAWGY